MRFVLSDYNKWIDCIYAYTNGHKGNKYDYYNKSTDTYVSQKFMYCCSKTVGLFADLWYNTLYTSVKTERRLMITEKIGMDRTYFASVELGKRNISIVNLEKIAQGLNISLSDMFLDI